MNIVEYDVVTSERMALAEAAVTQIGLAKLDSTIRKYLKAKQQYPSNRDMRRGKMVNILNYKHGWQHYDTVADTNGKRDRTFGYVVEYCYLNEKTEKVIRKEYYNLFPNNIKTFDVESIIQRFYSRFDAERVIQTYKSRMKNK